MCKNTSRLISWAGLSIVIFLISGCSQINPISNTPDSTATLQPSPSPTVTPLPTPTSTLSYIDIMPRSWNRYAHFDWKHDGHPFDSEHVIVFSDHSSEVTKERFATELESALETIISALGITKEDRSIPINLPKIEVFITSRRFGKVDWEGYAHYGGFLLVYDGKSYSNRMTQFPDQFPYTYLLRHELTHVIVLRILGNKQTPTKPIPEWFDEGLATYMGVPPVPIRTLQRYEIAIRDKKPSYWFYFYHLNELMVYYLIETYGMDNVTGILFDMRDKNLTFEESFENRTGMTADDYEQNFDSLMKNFFASE